MSVCCSGAGVGCVSGCDVQAHQTSGKVGSAIAQRRVRQLIRRMLRFELPIMEVLLVEQPTCCRVAVVSRRYLTARCGPKETLEKNWYLLALYPPGANWVGVVGN